MSGFVGFLNLDGRPADRALVEDMTDPLTACGPDTTRVVVAGEAGLGHALLRTTPEQDGERSPWSDDGRIWIAGDARLDARQDLLQALARAGQPALGGRPDVELVLHAYRTWGDACVERMVGDFAFVIWDRPRRRLFCARDHFGVKPFYYAHLARSFVFGNTLDALRLHPAVSTAVNDAAIADFLMFEYNRDVATTAYADIARLPAAHTLTLALVDGKAAVSRYWSLSVDATVSCATPGEYVDGFRTVLGAAVNDRLRTDRAAIFMSGGVDSTTVAAAAVRFRPRGARPCTLRAFTTVYDRLFDDPERTFARAAADALGVPISFQVGDDHEPYSESGDTPFRPPEPANDPDCGLWRDQYRDVARHARVALTGFGGDPAFRYLTDVVALARRGRFARLSFEVFGPLVRERRLPPVGLRTSLRRLCDIRGRKVVRSPPWIRAEVVRRFELEARWARTVPVAPRDCDRPLAYEGLVDPVWPYLFELHAPGYTGFPIEVRHPIFDLRVIRFIFGAPAVPWSVNKRLLREAGRHVLPPAVVERPKTPFRGDPVGEAARRSSGPWPPLGWWRDGSTDLSRFIEPGRFAAACQQVEGPSAALRVVGLQQWFSRPRPVAPRRHVRTAHGDRIPANGPSAGQGSVVADSTIRRN